MKTFVVEKVFSSKSSSLFLYEIILLDSYDFTTTNIITFDKLTYGTFIDHFACTYEADLSESSKNSKPYLLKK